MATHSKYSCLGNPILCPPGPRELSRLSTHTHLKPQAQEGSSHRLVPDLCLASGLELSELPCAGAAPEVTAELLILLQLPGFPSQQAHRVVLN